MLPKSVRFYPSAHQLLLDAICTNYYGQSRGKSSREIKSRAPSIKKIPINNTLYIPPPIVTSKAIKSARLLELESKFMELVSLRTALMKQYRSLQLFYETNEQKLRTIILNELNRNKSYLYSKQTMAFIKNPDFNQVKTLNMDLFKNDIIKVTNFLTSFNAKKRIRQVQIMKQTMLKRQSMIREFSSSEEYQKIFKNMRKPLKLSGYTIYDQLKSIQVDFNLPINSNNVHQQLYNKICLAQNEVNGLMAREVKKKQNQRLSLASFNNSQLIQPDGT